MKPYLKIAEATLPDGTVFTLHRHDGQIYLKNDPLDLMSTSLTYSEQKLAELGCARLVEGASTRPESPRVLIGGLGLGFTLKKTLEIVGRPATVTVARQSPIIGVAVSDGVLNVFQRRVNRIPDRPYLQVPFNEPMDWA